MGKLGIESRIGLWLATCQPITSCKCREPDGVGTAEYEDTAKVTPYTTQRIEQPRGIFGD